MDLIHYREMKAKLENLLAVGGISEKEIYIFGHCNASEELADLLMDRGYRIAAILDNSSRKQGGRYREIPIMTPQAIVEKQMERMLILIVSRAYEAMAAQLKQLGYTGRLEKLVEYNTFSSYSLSRKTIAEKRERVIRGADTLNKIRKKYGRCFYILCPFSALGDVYYAMAYLPCYLEKNRIQRYAVVTVGRACAEIVKMFGCVSAETLNQQEMDELVQVVLFSRAEDVLIAHHDRPYANLLMKALYVRLISFEALYRYGVFGLEKECIPDRPSVLSEFSGTHLMERGNAVVLAPHAKSVAGVGSRIWEQIVSYYRKKGCQIFTNVAGEEKPLPGTLPLKISLMELSSAVEWAGTFIGIRSGLCDVIRDVSCRKVVLFPDCFYSDTRWKVAAFFYLEGWSNIVVREDALDVLEGENGTETNGFIHFAENLDL